jgi:hypothetical protein
MRKSSLSWLVVRVKGGMLSLVLSISLIIVFIAAALISLAFYFRVLNYDLDTDNKLSRNSFSGVHYLLSLYPQFPKQHLAIDLFDQGVDSVDLFVEPWGIFHIGYAKAFSKRRSEELCFIIGNKPDLTGTAALYLADENKPLQLAGQSVLTGHAFLPKAGIRKAYIKSKPLRAGKLMEGRMMESQAQLPELDPAIQQQLSLLLTSPYLNDSSITLDQSVIVRRFVQPSLIFHSDEEIVLRNKISGKVVIHSTKAVYIASSAVLENVVVIAPEIVIQNQFQGALQAFASDTLIVEDDVTLKFPSVVGLVGKQNSYMDIRRNVTMEGLVISCNPDLQGAGIVSIGQGTRILGQVYANGSLIHQGNVHGNVMCRRLLANLPSGTFENHLIDATIDNRLVAQEDFLGIGIISSETGVGVLKWLQ